MLLKSYAKGELLAIIGRDVNNEMFLIVWIVVDVEFTDTWKWFINMLKNNLKLDDGHRYTLMINQQNVYPTTSFKFFF